MIALRGNPMRVADLFCSFSGEVGVAIPQGSMVTFLRFAGCPLECAWCDTPETQPILSGSCIPIVSLKQMLVEFGGHYLIITGGEPAIQPKLEMLLNVIAPMYDKIVIETSGGFDLSYMREVSKEKISFCVDYKLPSSGVHENYVGKFNYSKLGSSDVIKFPIATEDDAKLAIMVAKELQEKFMLADIPMLAFSLVGSWPEGSADWLFEELSFHRINGTINVQVHKILCVK